MLGNITGITYAEPDCVLTASDRRCSLNTNEIKCSPQHEGGTVLTSWLLQPLQGTLVPTWAGSLKCTLDASSVPVYLVFCLKITQTTNHCPYDSLPAHVLLTQFCIFYFQSYFLNTRFTLSNLRYCIKLHLGISATPLSHVTNST